MLYYNAIVKLGHVGQGNNVETCVYVYGKNAYEAMKFAQKIPEVKHNKIPNLIKITKEEYQKGIEEKEYYLKMDLINNL